MSADLTKFSQPNRIEAPALLTKALIRRFFVPAGERTLDRWISSGTFPRPDIRLGGKTRFWRRATVEAWIDAQAGQPMP